MIVNCCRRRHSTPALALLLIACALLSGPARPMGPGLTNEQLARLLKVVEKHGSHARIPPTVASMLQFKPGQVLPDIKQAAFVDEDGIKHGIAPLNDGSGFFMFRSGPALGQSVYHVDSKLQLVQGARSFVRQQLMVLTNVEAQKELEDEFGLWSKALSPGGPAASIEDPKFWHRVSPLPPQ
jgi:hypothetical protein